LPNRIHLPLFLIVLGMMSIGKAFKGKPVVESAKKIMSTFLQERGTYCE
jgi:hypothetical protein